MKLIIQALSTTKFSDISLAGCNLEVESLELLSRIDPNWSCTSLSLSRNVMGPRCASALGNLCGKLPAVKEINLSQIALTSGLPEFCGYIINEKYFQNVTLLNLSGNHIDWLGFNSLVQVLPHLPQLQSLDLADNQISSFDLLSGLKASKLSSLNLRNNQIPHTQIGKLLENLNRDTIITLILDSNPIATDPLFEKLNDFQALKTLSLRNCKISGKISLCQGRQPAPNPETSQQNPKSSLNRTRSQSIHISPTECFLPCQNLIHLDLSENPEISGFNSRSVTDIQILHLKDTSFPISENWISSIQLNCPKIEFLDLSRSKNLPINQTNNNNNNFNNNNGKLLRDFCHFRSLKTLCWTDLSVSENEICKFFQENSTLHSLELADYPLSYYPLVKLNVDFDKMYSKALNAKKSSTLLFSSKVLPFFFFTSFKKKSVTLFEVILVISCGSGIRLRRNAIKMEKKRRTGCLE